MPSSKPIITLTPSNVSDLACAKKFHTLRELGLWPRKAIHPKIRFGTAFHRVLMNVYDPTSGPPPHIHNLDLYVKQAFFAARYTDITARSEDMARCLEMVRCYVRNDDLEDIEGTIAVEKPGSIIAHHDNQPICRVFARLDRVLVRASKPDELVIRDCKTSRPRVELGEAFIQLWVAKSIYPDYRSYVIEYDWVDASGHVERDVVRSADVKNILFLTTSRALCYANRTDYPAEPGEACTFCPLRPECQPDRHVTLDSLEDDDER